MLQRNDTGQVRQVMAWPTEEEPDRQLFDVGPGEEIDFPELLGGFTPMEEPDDKPEAEVPEPEEPPAEEPVEPAAPAADEEEGEPE